MHYAIASDIPGRLRLRLGSGLLTDAEARGISQALRAVPGVRTAEVHPANGSVIVTGDPIARPAVLACVRGLDVMRLPTAPETGELSLAAEDNDFTLKVAGLVVRRLMRRAFLPMPVRRALSVLRSLRRIAAGVRALLHGQLTVEVLDAAAIASSFIRGAFEDASSIMFLLRLSDILQDHVQNRARIALTEGLVTRAETVWQVVDGQDVEIAMADVRQGQVLHVRSGQVLPVDGVVLAGEAEINEASMTGESMPVHKEYGSSVYAGTALENGDLQVEVIAPPGRARIDQIADLVENSSELKARSQSRAEHLADALVPWSFLAFASILGVTRNLQRAMAVLMVDYSCAIKLSTPIAVMSAMREAVNAGVVVKGGKYLEALAAADTVVFDKTGTLTVAAPQVERVLSTGDMGENAILRYAACIEEHFPHSVARAIVNEANARGLNHDSELHAEVHYVVAHGISTTVAGERTIIGSAHFVFEDEGIEEPEGLSELLQREAPTASHIFIAASGKLEGVICIADPIRPEAASTIARLREQGIRQVVMLTGDSERCALAVARELGVDVCHYQVLPEDKSSYVQRLRDEGHTVVMVGDGINDSPALAAADVSVALSDASDIARAVADISVRDDSLESLVTMRELAQRLMARLHAKYRLIVGLNSALIALGVAQAITLTTAAYLHNGSTVLIAAHNTTPLLRAGGARREEVAAEDVVLDEVAGG